MIVKNHISIFRKPKVTPIIDYCLQFNGNGYISIDTLTPFLDHNTDFHFEIQFKINSIPTSGFNYLMNSCLNKISNKIGVAIDFKNLYFQIDKGSGNKTELSISFSDTSIWHTLFLSNDRGFLFAVLDLNFLSINLPPVLSLPSNTGFRIASDTNNSQNLNGLVNNILITDLRVPLAQYLLNEGSGSVANDSVGHNNGSIINGLWSLL